MTLEPAHVIFLKAALLLEKIEGRMYIAHDSLNLKEVAKMIGICLTTARDWAVKGKIPGGELTKKGWFFHRVAFHRWFDVQKASIRAGRPKWRGYKTKYPMADIGKYRGYLNRREAAMLIGVTPETISAWATNKRIPAVMTTRGFRFSRPQLLAWLRENVPPNNRKSWGRRRKSGKYFPQG